MNSQDAYMTGHWLTQASHSYLTAVGDGHTDETNAGANAGGDLSRLFNHDAQWLARTCDKLIIITEFS